MIDCKVGQNDLPLYFKYDCNEKSGISRPHELQEGDKNIFMPMKTIEIVASRTWGGGERYVLDLARTLKNEGEEVEIITKGEKPTDEPFKNAGLSVSRLPLGGEFDIITPILLSRRLRRDPSRRILIHVHNFRMASLAVKARALAGNCGKEICILCTRHLVKTGKRSARATGIYSGLDGIIFVSELARREFLSGNPEVNPEKLHVVHNSIIPPRDNFISLNPPAVNSAESTPEPRNSNEVTLLFIGRISEEKGLETLIRALGRLRDLPLRLRIAGVGKGPYVSRLKGEVWRANVTDRVEWLGHCDDVYEEIRRADIGVAPSTARESFGLVLLEFMSQGVPVITTDHGAQPEVITSGEDGLLVPPDNTDALAKAIRTLAESADLRRRIGEKGLETFHSRFAYPRFIRELKGVAASLFKE